MIIEGGHIWFWGATEERGRATESGEEVRWIGDKVWESGYEISKKGDYGVHGGFEREESASSGENASSDGAEKLEACLA